jgi:hypothetical protein
MIRTIFSETLLVKAGRGVAEIVVRCIFHRRDFVHF